MIKATLILGLALIVLPACATGLAGEVGDTIDDISTGIVENFELSLVAGSVGWGAGLYWPMLDVEDTNMTFGPFIALGDDMVAAGFGAKLPIVVPVFEKLVDFIAVGAAYKHGELSREFWLGKAIPIY